RDEGDLPEQLRAAIPGHRRRRRCRQARPLRGDAPRFPGAVAGGPGVKTGVQEDEGDPAATPGELGRTAARTRAARAHGFSAFSRNSNSALVAASSGLPRSALILAALAAGRAQADGDRSFS